MIDVMNAAGAGKEAEKGLDPQLWHACAGGMVQIPPINSTLIYFPQGHIEHSQVSVDLTSFPSLPPLLPCRLSSITYLADPDSDEVFAKLTLLPLQQQLLDEPLFSPPPPEDLDKPASFAKTLTQSDANNGGGFSVPRYCAETIFPRLDYSAEPPVQTILAKDVHGVTWKFRHIYRGTPRRHLLTTGWSNFVNHKKLLAGDSIVFLRAENGDLCVGIRRAKKGIGGGPESPPPSGGGWNAPPPPPPPPCVGYAAFLRDDQRPGFGRVNSGLALGPGGRVGVDSVIQSARLAASGRPFEVVYYPRASTPEFCVKASSVRAAMQVHWCSGMRFKMAFETEDSSRISWFMGTISAVQVADHRHWPNSPWRLLQVAWDEPELLQNVKRVNPWLVELVATMPPIHISPFSAPPRKKLRVSQTGHDFPYMDQLPMPHQLTNNPLKPSSPYNITAGIQGARHAHFGQPHFPTLGRLHSGLFPAFLKHPQNAFPAHNGFITSKPDKVTEDVSCFLTIGRHCDPSKKSGDDSSVSAPKFMLFGKPIHTEEQISQTSSGDSSSNVQKASVNRSDVSSCGPAADSSSGGHCKLFLESEDEDRTALDKKLANMFGIERPEMLNNVNNKPFSEFLKTARTLTVLADAGSENLAR